MVLPRLCPCCRFFRCLVWALFITCLFILLTGVGILFHLPEGSNTFQHRVAGSANSNSFWNSRNIIAKESEIKVSKPIQYNIVQDQDQWQQANPPNQTYKLLVYSAYWDGRTNPPCVRVIGSTLTKNSPSVTCRLQFANGQTADIQAAKKPINEHWNLKYAGFIFSCCSKGFGQLVPVSVTVFDVASSNVSASLPVRVNSETRSFGGQLALCVKPFHYNFNRAAWLIEFVEFYRMMGVEHFLFYNESVGEDVEAVLRHYQKSKIVSVLPWKLFVQNQKEVRTQNMFAALNDCNYRLMYLYRYVISVDLDEFIVPKKQGNLTDLMNNLSKEEKGQKPCIPSYIFQNVFFYLYWKNDTTSLGEEPESPPNYVPYLLTQYKTQRVKEPHKHGKRSKFVALPHLVLEVGNHITWRHTESCKPYKVPSTMGLLHHYRICEFGGFDCLKTLSTVDRTAHAYGAELLKRVWNVCESTFDALEEKCPRSPPLGSPW